MLFSPEICHEVLDLYSSQAAAAKAKHEESPPPPPPSLKPREPPAKKSRPVSTAKVFVRKDERFFKSLSLVLAHKASGRQLDTQISKIISKDTLISFEMHF